MALAQVKNDKAKAYLTLQYSRRGRQTRQVIVQALKQAGKNGVSDVLLVGFNGDAPALELIKAGEMAATIRQDPYGQGRAAVEAALKMLEGEAVEYSDEATRSIYFPVDVVTADNVDEFMQ